jgi:hypothetical protein
MVGGDHHEGDEDVERDPESNRREAGAKGLPTE